jgi:nucleoside-diphosphate-sugar epimerase
MLGMPRRVPCPPESQSDFWGEAYARRWKVIQAVLRQSAAGGPKFTAILPPNICGPGKIPLETRGGRSIEVHRALAAGETVVLPEGAEVLIGPCDAEDVAQSFYRAATQPEASAGRIFNVGSAYALTATEFVATYAQIYSVNIPIRRVNWSEFSTQFVPDPGSRYHFESHMCPDITDTRSRLGYKPRFTPEQTMHRAVEWMRSRNVL